jgi:hypothetical protein
MDGALKKLGRSRGGARRATEQFLTGVGEPGGVYEVETGYPSHRERENGARDTNWVVRNVIAIPVQDAPDRLEES